MPQFEFEEEAMSLLAFYYRICDFPHHYWSLNPPSCRFSPFHLSYVAVSRPRGLLEFYRGRGALGLIFAGYVPLASQSPYPIIAYSMANLSHFYPKNPKMHHPILVNLFKMQPHYSQSSHENATTSSGTSPKASYKEVPPSPPI